MPELPEVETVVRDLRPRLVGRTLTGLRVGKRKLRHSWKPGWTKLVAGRRVAGLRRRGKWIIVDFDNGTHLLVHLGMTGRFTVELETAEIAPHTHLIFSLDVGGHLRFRDVRRFGSVRFCAKSADLERELDPKLGPEPWALQPAEFRASLKATRRSLKAVLLDQSVVAGVGNIYADEALFAAKLPPTQLGCQTTPAQAERLRHAMIQVLEKAIQARGSTVRTYVGGNGEKGGYQRALAVYGRAGKECPRCGAPIRSIRLAGRSTHFCPACQRGRAKASRPQR